MNIFKCLRRRHKKPQPQVVAEEPQDSRPKGRYIHFPKSLTDHVDNRQVLYFNPTGDPATDQLIDSNYDAIVRRFADAGLQFIHPAHLQFDLRDVITYHRPDLPPEALQQLTLPDPARFTDIVRNACLDPLPEAPVLLRFKKELTMKDFSDAVYQQRDARVIFSLFIIEGDATQQLDDILAYPDLVGDDDLVVRFSVAHSNDPDDAADYKIDQISDEIRQRVEQLRHLGVGEAFILSLLDTPQTISPLVITPDFKIMLPDYGNIEIHLEPLAKALYFFYLRHPEGVMFKHLRDHSVELTQLYMLVSNRQDIDKMRRSIFAIIDSTKNSVNEKSSRIKEAFLLSLDDSIAKQYYITGCTGNPRQIILSRDLVQDRSGLIINKPEHLETADAQPTDDEI